MAEIQSTLSGVERKNKSAVSSTTTAALATCQGAVSIKEEVAVAVEEEALDAVVEAVAMGKLLLFAFAIILKGL